MSKPFEIGDLVETTRVMFSYDITYVSPNYTIALGEGDLTSSPGGIVEGSLGTVTGYVNRDPRDLDERENRKRLWVFIHSIGKEVLIKKKYIRIYKEDS